MKKTIWLLVLACMVTPIYAQKLEGIDVPQMVREAFVKRFPEAKNVKWEKENDSEIEAEFSVGKVKYSSNFDLSGTWLETENEIKKNALPVAVLTTITKEFPGYKIDEAEKSITPNGEGYEVTLEKGDEEWEVYLSASGQVLKKEKMEEEDDD